MKRGIYTVGTLLMIFLLASLTIAESSKLSTSNQKNSSAKMSMNTKREINIMRERHGAKVRILQLQKAIEKLVLHAEAIIEVVKEKGNNTDNLEEILAEMKILLDEVKSLDPTSENATEEFVNIKEDAINLRKEFRDAVKPLLNSEDKKRLKEKFKEIDKSKLKKIREQIRKEIRAYNANRLRELGNTTGEKFFEEYAKKIENGEINTTKALKELRKKYASMNKEEKEKIRKQVEERKRKQEEERVKDIERIQKRRAEMVMKRENKRLEILKKKFPKLSERLRNRVKELNRTQTNFSNERTNDAKNKILNKVGR